MNDARKNFESYIITSGWWCCDKEVENRDVLCGSDEIRSVDFHSLWKKALTHFTNPKAILVVDSASPIVPNLDEGSNNFHWLRLLENFGHSTRLTGKYCGWSRACFIGMLYAYFNDVEYWVYIEQDALVWGDGIVEHAISNMKRSIMFGAGAGTPQPIQQSFMIIHRSAIIEFFKALLTFKSTDMELSPEMKFAIASSKVLKALPEFFFVLMEGKGLVNKIARLLGKVLFSVFKGYDELPFGFGRARPLKDSEYYYFQHGSKVEIQEFVERLSKYRNRDL